MNIAEVLRAYRSAVDKHFRKFLQERLKQFPVQNNKVLKLELESIKNSCLIGGKRLRPILTILGYKAARGKQEDKIMDSALVFELFHTYTLVHDDVYDEDLLRRHKPTFHAGLTTWFKGHRPDGSLSRLYKDRGVRFGVVGAVLGGEILHNLCLEAILNAPLSDDKKMEGLRLYAKAAPGDNLCQLLDLAYEAESINEAKYLELARLKSGVLMGAAAEWGVILAGGSKTERRALREYGEYLGQAFQIQDDLLDLDPEGNKGRPLGSDLRTGKQTLPVIHALRSKNKIEVERCLARVRSRGSGIKDAIKALEEARSLEYCHKVIERLTAQARNSLNNSRLEDEPRRLLSDLADYLIARNA